MGYCWPGRLRSSPSSLIPRLTCDPDLFRCGLARFARQRPGEGGCLISNRLHIPKQRNVWVRSGPNVLTYHNSGSLRFCTSARVSLLFSSAARRIFATTARLLMSLPRPPSAPSRKTRYAFPAPTVTQYKLIYDYRVRKSARRSVPTSTLSAPLAPTRVSVKSSRLPLVLLS